MDKVRILLLFGSISCLLEIGKFQTIQSKFCKNSLTSTFSDCPLTQPELDYIAENLVVTVNSIDNLKDDGKRHKVQIKLHNNGTEPIRGKDWVIYFYSFFMVEPDHLPNAEGYIDDDYKVKYKHVRGSLYSIEPVNGFKDILPNASRTIEHKSRYWSVSKSDFLPNWYITSGELEPRTINSTRENSTTFLGDMVSAKQWKRYKHDTYNPFTSQDRYNRYFVPHKYTNGPSVVPTPKHFVESQSFGKFTIDDTWTIRADKGGRSTAKFLSDQLNLPIDQTNWNGKSISLNLIQNGKGREWYSIETNINAPNIIISATTEAGLFYGAQSLISLLEQFKKNRVISLFPFNMEDEPRFEFRGLRLDVSRHFRSKEEILRLIDLMAMYKLNKLSLMLGNDEGWRLEIPLIPELVEVGSRQCHDLTETRCLLPQLGNPVDMKPQYYTGKDYMDILKYAKSKHVEIIPEINMPGHAHALKRAIESRAPNPVWSDPERMELSLQNFEDDMLNPCSQNTFKVLYVILKQIQTYHEEANVKLNMMHTGGDGPYTMDRWINSTDCINLGYETSEEIQTFFDSTVSTIIDRLNANVAGYADGFMDSEGNPQPVQRFKTPEVVAHYWNNAWGSDLSRAYDLANAGYKVVLGPASHLYFDHPHEPNPDENGLYWATRFIDTKKVFSFEPENIYNGVTTKHSGEPVTEKEVCGEMREKCPPLLRPDNIKGVEASMYGELIRSRDMLDYMLFPRLLALAERAWHNASWEGIDSKDKRETAMVDDWLRFARIVGEKELNRLDDLGVKYRIAPPGGTSDGKRMDTNTEFPGQIVEYSPNSGRKWRKVPNDWLISTGNNRILIRTVPSDGRIKTNTDHLGEKMEFSIDKGKTWKQVPITWSLASYNPLLLRTRSANGKRLSRRTEFDPRGINPIPDQNDVDRIARSLHVKYDIEDNLADTDKSFLYRITFTNIGNETLAYGNWSIYMYNIRLVEPKNHPYPNGYLLHDCSLWLHHVGGSLYRLDPEQTDFKIPVGKSLSCLLSGEYWEVSRTDVMPNWFVAAEGMDPVVINNTASEELDFVVDFDTSNKWKRYPDDQYNPYSPKTRFGINKDIKDDWNRIKPLIPTPSNLTINKMNAVYIGGVNNQWKIVRNPDFPKAVQDLADYFNLEVVDLDSLTIASQVIFLVKENYDSPPLPEKNEMYQISVDTNNKIITITAQHDAGMFYAVQTLKNVASKNGGDFYQIPEMTGYDRPRYSYRGMHLDVVRNFHTKKEVMKLLDLMSRYKLNKLHLHLTDDEGWRIEIPELQELTQIGAQRCYDLEEEECILPQIGSAPSKPNTGSGFYTTEDYKDILRYAAERHIEIIPEINTPGHARAAIVAMEDRYKKYMKSENKAEANKFILSNMEDDSHFLSRQEYTHNVVSPCLPSSYDFLGVVVRALYDMHNDTQPLQTIHFGGPGGDEFSSNVWNHSRECRALSETIGLDVVDEIKFVFVNNLAREVPEKVKIGFWEDAVMEGKTPFYRFRDTLGQKDIIVYAWRNIWEKKTGDNAHILANQDYKVVISHATDLFFDHPYEPDPEERGYYWATRFTNTRKVFGFIPGNLFANARVSRKGVPLTKNDTCPPEGCEVLKKPDNIVGMQGQVWTETIRHPDQLEYMTAPRILALAERAWHHSYWEDIGNKIVREKERDKEWEEFANTLGHRELRRLDDLGFKYRLSPPGAEIIDDELHVNTEFPGLPIEISVDNKKTWQPLKSKRRVTEEDKLIHLRSTSPDGKRHSRIITVTPELQRKQINFFSIPFLNRFLKYLNLSLQTKRK